MRRILGISWQDKVTNERVLQEAKLPSLTALLKQRRLTWLGHVQRMEPCRIPRRVLLSELADANRDVGRPLLRFKDCVKRDMFSFGIDHHNWEELSNNRSHWRKSLVRGRELCDGAWLSVLADKRKRKHQGDSVAAAAVFPCQRCGRRCLSRIGLFSHQRKFVAQHL